MQKVVNRLWVTFGWKRKMITDRLSISTLSKADAGSYLELVRIPQVAAYIGHDSSDIGLEQVKKFLKTGAAEGYSYAMKTKNENRFIGVCGRSKSQILTGYPDIFIYIHPSFWRKGYASEALKRFIYFLLIEEGVPGVTARVKKGNHASEQLMNSIAMKLYGESQNRTENIYQLDRDFFLSNIVF